MYDRQAHLRPSFDSRQQNEDGSWLYEFSCTPMQIYFYFLSSARMRKYCLQQT